MNSRQYEKKITEYYQTVLSENGLTEDDYTSVCLSANRAYYSVLLTSGEEIQIESGMVLFDD